MNNGFSRILLKVVFCCTLIVLTLQAAISFAEEPGKSLVYASTTLNQRDRLIAEILQADTELTVLQAEKQRSEAQLATLMESLELLEREHARLADKIDDETAIAGEWLRFLSEEGASVYLEIVLTAGSLNDLLDRWENVLTIIETNVNKLELLKSFSEQHQLQEREVQARLTEITRANAYLADNIRQMRAVRDTKTASLANAEKTLADFSAVLAISQAWEYAVPDIDQTLDRLRSLPWAKTKPDDIKIDYLRGSAVIITKEDTLQQMINQGLETADHFSLRCQHGLVILERPVFHYSLQFKVQPDKDRIVFEPYRVLIHGFEIPIAATESLYKNSELNLNTPMVSGLKITNIVSDDGELRIYLGRN